MLERMRTRGRDPHGWVAALIDRLAALPDGDVAPVARRAGMAERALRRLRRGENADVRLSTLERLSLALGESASELLGEERRPPQRPGAADPSYDLALRVQRQVLEIGERMAEDIQAHMRRTRTPKKG